MCQRPFGGSCEHHKLPSEKLGFSCFTCFHHSFFNPPPSPPRQKKTPNPPTHVQEPRQTGLYQQDKTQTVPYNTKPTKPKSIPILIVFKHLDGLFGLQKILFALSTHLLFVVSLSLAVSSCLSVLGKREAATSWPLEKSFSHCRLINNNRNL